jgi:hypothetical protein
MKHVAFGKTLLWNNRSCGRFHLEQNFSFQRRKPRCGSNRSCAPGLSGILLQVCFEMTVWSDTSCS